MIAALGYASYFLTVGDVTDLIREMGVRCAARGSGAGSLVNYLLGVSGVDPIRHDLLMERFLSPLRQALPDIDIDVESARRLEVYEAILDRYGGERCVCVSMMDTYRVRHAVRDVGAALGHAARRDRRDRQGVPAHPGPRRPGGAARAARAAGLAGSASERLDLMFRLVERLDGLPRHIAVHPCGVLLSDATLLDRTPVEAQLRRLPDEPVRQGRRRGPRPAQARRARHPDAVLDGARASPRSSGSTGVELDLDDEAQVPFDDAATFAMISQRQDPRRASRSSRRASASWSASPASSRFDDIITDISLFRPGPVKSDMITPYLEAKQGWKTPALPPRRPAPDPRRRPRAWWSSTSR